MKIESIRLNLRELTLNDTDNLFQLDSNVEVMKYMGRPPVRDRNSIISVLEKKIDYNKNNPGLGYWALIERKHGSFVGQFSLAHIDFDKSKEIEIGFRLLPTFWHLGYATEMGNQLIKYGFDYLQLKRIVALAHPDNLASQKVLEKISLKYIRDDFYYNNYLRFFEIIR